MTTLENFNLLITELATFLNLPELKADDFGMVTLEIDNMPMFITYSDKRESILFTRELATVPANAPAKLFRRLLAAQLFEEGTGGSYFALDDESGTVLLSFELVLFSTPFDVFKETLESYLNLADFWKLEIDKMINAENIDSDTTSAPVNGMLKI